MSDDDPFAEPDDTERTVIRPNPGGRRTAAFTPSAPIPVVPQAAPDIPASDGSGSSPTQTKQTSSADVAMTGMNALCASATTLFSLVSRIRNRAQHMEPEKLRTSVVAEVRAFQNRALQSGVDMQQFKVARYAMCATLDDVVLNTPWGQQSNWSQQSMVGTFHRETVGGDRFFDLLARLERDPTQNLDLLEFLYMCLSLGFEGRLRVEQGGSDKHLQVRNSLARVIRTHRGAVENELSPRWAGVLKPNRALSAWRPVWLAVGIVSVILPIGYAGLSFSLSRTTGSVLGQLTMLESGVTPELRRRAPPPPPPPPATEPTLRRGSLIDLLGIEIAAGTVAVFEDTNTLTIRMSGSEMFSSGSDGLQDSFESSVRRVAEALNIERGPVIIVGHSDNVPIRSARFQSNMHLSLARAESVMSLMVREFDDPQRLVAEGRADKEPIADNGTAKGRATNRRIEIQLLKVGNL